MMKNTGWLAAIPLLMGCGMGAQAVTLNVNLKANAYSAVALKFNGTNFNAYAGTFTENIDGGTSFDAYCVDIADEIPVPTSYSVTAQPLSSLANSGGVAWLYNNLDAQVSNSIQGAALQVAIWNVEYNNKTTLGSSSDAFQFANPNDNSTQAQVATLATQYLGQWNFQTSSSGAYYTADQHPNGTNQNMFGPSTSLNPRVTSVPEPGMVSLLASGLVGASTLVLRRRKKR